jgi:cysteine-rich repeat protein
VQAGGSATWSAPTDEFTDAQISTYIYANIVKARDRLINPAVASWLDTQFPFNVNEDGSCNAFATATDVHFFRASAMCQNTGRLADIVFHEFGHSFHYNSFLLTGAPASELSEGLADFNAANITEDPGIGRGFFYTDEPDRDIDPPGRELAYPQDVVAVDPHQTGLIISGALWDLRTELVRELGHGPGVNATEKVFAGILQRAADIPSTYMAALVADDDDADLGNGTPHYCAIERAFGRHGLAPGFMDTVIGTPVIDGSTISVAVTPPASADCPASQVTAIHVTWHAGDGVPSTFDLQPGSPWTGAFPSLPPGTLVRYTVEAMRDDGTSVVFPQNPADPEYQWFVGPAINIWCDPMDHDPMWNQSGNYGVEWNWGQPTAGGGDPYGSHTGLDALGTQVGGNGLYLGTTSTWIETPAIDVSTYAQVHLQYWRWLTVEDRAYDAATIQVNGQVAWQNAISNGKTLDHLDREWRFQDVDLTPYITDGTAQVRWTLDSDSSNQFGGWTLDDVCIVALIKYPLCGDGVVDPGEQCDDGNTTSGDGCSKQCIDEPTAGGGGCSAASEPGGLLLLLLAGLARAGGRRDRSRRARRSTSSDRADRRRS